MGSSRIGVAIKQFLDKHQDVKRVAVTDTGVDIFFKNNPNEPFVLSEFTRDSKIRRDLATLEAAIYERP